MKSLLLLFGISLSLNSIAQKKAFPQVSRGKIVRIENFNSKYVTKRNIDIWLPEHYSNDEKYEVLYMHDGQMLFDVQTTWNKQSWNIAHKADSLISLNLVRKFIVVGIWNDNTTRHPDYFPSKPYHALNSTQKQQITDELRKKGRISEDFKPNSDQYLKFIVEELKPFIDKNYSVKTEKESTFIAGSSMGGLISWYALFEYPKVFGGAACLSTHWPGIFSLENNPIPDAFLRYIKKKINKKSKQKIYFDCGDQTLDALYPEIQKRVDELFRLKYIPSNNWKTMYFPGTDHSENAWSQRLHHPLLFLFGH